MGLLTEKGVTLGTTKSSGGLLQQQGYKKITDIKPVNQVTPPTTQPISFAGKAPVSALFSPVTSPIPPKTVTKPTTGVFPTLQTKLAEKPYVSPYPTEKPATISPAGETILKTVAKTGVSLLEQVTKGLDYTQDLIAKNLISKKQPTFTPIANLNDKWLNWYTQKESKGELLTQKAQKFVDTLAKSDYVQNRPEWEVLPLKEKLKKENLGETILNLVPSVLSSVALYAINPAVGFVTSASSTAQDVKEDAIKNGVDEKKAEKLALATGLTVGALDKIVPDDVFRNNEIKKLFLKDFMKNLVRRTVTEAGTEIAQEDIQMIAEQTYREISKDEKQTRRVMSMLGGALGGAGFSMLGDFANTTVQNDIMQTPPTKKKVVEEVKFSSPQKLADEIGNSEPGGVKSVDQLSKTLETKDDEIYRDRVEEYKQKIQSGEAIDPIVVNEKEEVLDGGHRLTAMQELGIKATETVVQKEKPVVEKPTKVAKKVETNEALLEEARKYKSAEEFVRAQGEPVYHGTSAKFEPENIKEGVYLTPSKKYADVYQSPSASSLTVSTEQAINKRSGQPRTLEYVIPKNAKIFDATNPEHLRLLDKYWNTESVSGGFYPTATGQLDWTEGENVARFLKENGYKFDGIKIGEGGGVDAMGNVIERTDSIKLLNPKILKTKSQLTDIYNQAKGLTPEVKQKVVEKVEERKIETIAKPIEYIEKQVETTKDIKSVKTTLSSIRNELDNAIAEAEGKSIVATEQRAGLDTKKIGELKRIASLSKEYRAGNWDILKTKHGNLVDYVVEDVQRLHPEMEYDEAIDFALNLPTKAEESSRTPIIRELEKKQKKLAKYLELLKKRQDELKVKTDNETDKQWREILSAQEKLIKIVSVAREKLPLGEGKKKVSRLEARVNKISKKISNLDQETIDRLSLATYNQLNKKENISKAVKYVKQNPEKALKVLTGEIEAPNGILRNAIYVAMQNEAIGDVELARKIASIGATRLGQEISILTEIDPNSPVKVMSDVIKIKEEAFNKRFGKQRKTEVTEKSVNELKKSVKKPDKYDWQNFISQIQC